MKQKDPNLIFGQDANAERSTVTHLFPWGSLCSVCVRLRGRCGLGTTRSFKIIKPRTERRNAPSLCVRARAAPAVALAPRRSAALGAHRERSGDPAGLRRWTRGAAVYSSRRRAEVFSWARGGREGGGGGSRQCRKPAEWLRGAGGKWSGWVPSYLIPTLCWGFSSGCRSFIPLPPL